MSDGHGLPREQMLRPRTFFMHRRVVAVCAPLIAWSQPHWMASGGGEGGDGGGGGGGEGGGFGVGEGGGGGGGGGGAGGMGGMGGGAGGMGGMGGGAGGAGGKGGGDGECGGGGGGGDGGGGGAGGGGGGFGMAPPNIVFQGLWQEVCGHCCEPSSAGPSFAVGQMQQLPVVCRVQRV